MPSRQPAFVPFGRWLRLSRARCPEGQALAAVLTPQLMGILWNLKTYLKEQADG